MSFADELRNAPERLQKQADTKWFEFVKYYFVTTKEACRKAAADGRTDMITCRVSEFIKDCIAEPRWASLESRLMCKMSTESYAQFEPYLSEEDMIYFKKTITECFEREGLTVKCTERKLQKYALKAVYIDKPRYNTSGSLFDFISSWAESDDDDSGYYKLKKTKDGFRYDLYFHLSW